MVGVAGGPVIRAVVLDADGTVLRSDHTISPATREAVADVIGLGESPGESGDSTGSRASRRDVPASDATLILGLLHGCRHFQTAVELIGKRWSSAILLALARGATRFGEIRTLVPGLSDRMLAERMRELQAAKLVERDVVPTTPVQIRYHLTERGTDLIKSLHPLVKWGHPGKGRGMPTLTAIPPLKRRPGVLRDDGDGPG